MVAIIIYAPFLFAMNKDDKTAEALLLTLIAQPHPFKIGSRQYYLYPQSLGQSVLINNLCRRLGLDKVASKNPLLAALKAIDADASLVCRIIAYATCRSKEQCLDLTFIEEREKEFGSTLERNELATLLLLIITDDDIATFIHYLGLDREQQRIQKAMQARGDKNTLTFCGKSIYGTLIDSVCQRYGWTFDYVVWGISYANLKLLTADAIQTVFLTDEERRRTCLSSDNTVYNMDDPEARAKAIRLIEQQQRHK